METAINNPPLEEVVGIGNSSRFITANTVESSLEEIKGKHIIPVFSRDNEPLISHADFIDVVSHVANSVFKGERILEPSVRVSHPVKGRVPEARKKAANELLESEKTLYYERMAFMIELPSVCDQIEGNNISLSIGGVKAYNLDNLNGRKGIDQHFKMFIGFKNSVCTNLCISTDGLSDNLKAKSIPELIQQTYDIAQQYDAMKHLKSMKRLAGYELQEKEFAHMIGRARMYQFLENKIKRQLPELKLSDTQINNIVQGFYRDNSFSNMNGSINLWKLYNLFTGANKSSYIDAFLDRGVNSFHFVQSLASALENKHTHWFLN